MEPAPADRSKPGGHETVNAVYLPSATAQSSPPLFFLLFLSNLKTLAGAGEDASGVFLNEVSLALVGVASPA